MAVRHIFNNFEKLRSTNKQLNGSQLNKGELA